MIKLINNITQIIILYRLVLKYDNGCISAEVIDMIIKDFYPNYINKIR